MPLANMLSGRRPRRATRHAGSPAVTESGGLPDRIEDLRGPARGIVSLPLHLAWPGMRECDVSDGAARRGLYALLLARGTGGEIVRLVNGGLLREDWPAIAEAVGPELRRGWERVLGGAMHDRADGNAPAGAPAGAAGAAPDANPGSPVALA